MVVISQGKLSKTLHGVNSDTKAQEVRRYGSKEVRKQGTSNPFDKLRAGIERRIRLR
jgi:hypothetical protein